MSREKDTEDGDRQGLVEEGAICQPDKLTKDTKGSVEAKWVHEAAAKPPIFTHLTRPIPQASGLPEVMAIYYIIQILIYSVESNSCFLDGNR